MRKPGSRLLLLRLLVPALSCVAASMLLFPSHHASASGGGAISPAGSEQRSVDAFEAIVPVLHHPRCMNCHMSGDYPRQGDDSHMHIMQVKRGPDGHGAAPVRCSTCHQDHNLPGVHMPPGAPEWALPPSAHPMVWQGLSDRQLCLLLKNPQQNGYRTVSQIVDHMHTPLVLWGWHPGDGRKAIPMPQAQFEAYVSEWAANGAACPAR